MDPFLRRKIERVAEVNHLSLSAVVSICLEQAVPGIVEHGLLIRPIEDARFGYENLGCLAPQERDASTTWKYEEEKNGGRKRGVKDFEERASALKRPAIESVNGNGKNIKLPEIA